jgi:ribosomal protein S18 acetylase RimI-like enzyme
MSKTQFGNLFEPYDECHLRKNTADDVNIEKAKAEHLNSLIHISAQRNGFCDYNYLKGRFSKEILTMHNENTRVLLVAKIKTIENEPGLPSGWYLMGLVVKPEFRGLGIGLKLTMKRLDWLKQQTDFVYYYVNANNQVSIKLHEKIGFVQFGDQNSYPGITFTGGKGLFFRLDLKNFELET